MKPANKMFRLVFIYMIILIFIVLCFFLWGTETGGNLDIVESTPMMKESKSILVMGKHPGENTLKKELWIQFEAASRDGICFNPSTIQKTIQKDFLERLEEVSSDEATAEEGG